MSLVIFPRVRTLIITQKKTYKKCEFNRKNVPKKYRSIGGEIWGEIKKCYVKRVKL